MRYFGRAEEIRKAIGRDVPFFVPASDMEMPTMFYRAITIFILGNIKKTPVVQCRGRASLDG